MLVKRPNCRVMDRMQMECPFDLVLTRVGGWVVVGSWLGGGCEVG